MNKITGSRLRELLRQAARAKEADLVLALEELRDRRVAGGRGVRPSSRPGWLGEEDLTLEEVVILYKASETRRKLIRKGKSEQEAGRTAVEKHKLTREDVKRLGWALYIPARRPAKGSLKRKED